jgi:hypothetical protein
MRRQYSVFLTAMLLVCVLVVIPIKAQLKEFDFETLDSNLPEIERQGLITGASLAADFDGEGVNNDVALIDQGRGIVFVLIFHKNVPAPRSVNAINVRGMFGTPFVPTSATAFIDARTGLQDIAITAIASPISNDTNVGKIVVGINDGKGLFNDPQQFRSFDVSPGPTDINHGDFNNDGFDDLVFIDFRTNTVTVALNSTSDIFQSRITRDTGGIEPVSAVVGDFNDDDYMDLVVLNKGNTNSTVTTLFGDGQGRLFLSDSVVEVVGSGVSMVGGLSDLTGLPVMPDGKPLRRILDFNNDGFQDVAVLSASGTPAAANPVVTVLINGPFSAGSFRSQEPVELIEEVSKRSLIVAGEEGGAGLVSGFGFGPSPNGVGGGYHALGTADFNADGSPDLVVSSSIIPLPGTLGEGINFRAAIYLFGNETAGTVRVRGIRSGYKRAATFDPAEGRDTFVAAIPGAFVQAEDMVPGVLHVSLNGSIWIDRNNIGPFFCGRSPFIDIKRSDLNAPLGSGRKEIIFAGQTAEIPVTASYPIETILPFLLVPPPTGEQPPPFVFVTNNNNNTATIKIDSTGINPGPEGQVFRIGVLTQAPQLPPPGFGCGRLPLASTTYFTLVIKPKPDRPPVINSIDDQMVKINEVRTLSVAASDPAGSTGLKLSLLSSPSFVSLSDEGNGRGTIRIAPSVSDRRGGRIVVQVITSDGRTGQQTFNVTVLPNVVINGVSLDKARLTISGTGFGPSGATIRVNGQDISTRAVGQSDSVITLKGNRRKLNLAKGTNEITVTVQGETSNTFLFNF